MLNRRIKDGYVLRTSDLHVLQSVIPVLQQAGAAGVPIVIVSNQGGISRGLLSESDLKAVNESLLHVLGTCGVSVEAIYSCPHHPAAVEASDRSCDCRKPAPGLLLTAARDLNLALARSVFLGDQETDRQAGVRAGIPADRFWLVDAETLTPEAADRLADEVMAALR